MLLNSVRTVAPAQVSVSLADAKEHCRVDDNDSDDYITDLIQAAASRLDGCSGILGRCLITQTWQMTYDAFSSDLKLPFPVQSISSLKYYDQNNDEQTVATSDYELVKIGSQNFIRFISTYQFPTLYDYRTDRVSVLAVAGYGSNATDVPNELNHAIKMLVAHWYENRDAVVPGMAAAPLPMGFDAIIEPFRISGRS